jgi:hypothetical protein
MVFDNDGSVSKGDEEVFIDDERTCHPERFAIARRIETSEEVEVEILASEKEGRRVKKCTYRMKGRLAERTKPTIEIDPRSPSD